MGGAATPELAAAVTEAGAMGMLGAALTPSIVLADRLDQVSRRTSGAFGVNFLIPFLDDRDAVAAAAERCRLVEFFWGSPDPSLVEVVHEGGALAGWQVGSVEEARAAAGAGCDLLVAQGAEAGGHVRGEIALLPLLDLALEAVDVPVLAAGGIGSAGSVAAVLAAGAAGARVGTRFLAAEEADVHPRYLDALLAAGPEDTMLTTTFSTFWPDAPHRVLRDCVDAAVSLAEKGDDVVAEVEMPDGQRMPLPPLAPSPPGRSAVGHVEAMAHYAGQSVGHVRRREPAAAIVADLARAVVPGGSDLAP
jgi:nitronate monooxygenase